jgi:hypothetical protein
MIEFKSFKDLYVLLNVKNNLRKHRTNKKGRKYGCGMAKNMHEVMLKNTKIVVLESIVFVSNVNQMTTINNQ